MSHQTTLQDSPNAISSRESACGALPLDALGGQTISQFGQVLVLANLSARQAKEMGLLMSGIYGQRGSSSSHKSYLQQFLVSKLRQKTDSLGSTLYTMTWKGRTTPSGRTILALRASARRTSDKDFTSWPTPQAIDASGLARPPRFKTDIPRDPNNAGSWRTDLKDAPYLVNSMPQEGWRSPSASDGEGGIMEIRAGTTGRYKLRDEAPLASGWPTTTTRDGKGGYQGGRIRDGKVSTDTLDVTAQLSGWPTPQLMDFRSDTRVQGEHSDKAKAGGMLESEGTDFGDRLDYPDATNGLWRDADWLSCRDGKWRAVMPGAFPLVNGAPARVGRLRAYGNALCSAQAQGFIESFMEYKNESRS